MFKKATRKVIRNVVIVVTVIILIVFLRAQFVDVQNVMITVNVPGNSSLEELEEVLAVFEEREATGTFFIPGGWAEVHPEMLVRIATNHELACYSYYEKRLAPLNGSDLRREVLDCKFAFENVTNVSVLGFRAPANDVGVASYDYLNEFYSYDSSMYRRYEWFWEAPPEGFIEVPVTSLLALPLDDWFGVDVFHLNDFFFWVAQKAKQEPVVIAVTVGTVNEHLLDFEYLIASYQEEANVTTIREWIEK